MKVIVDLDTQSKPITIENVRNTYQKDGFYYVMLSDGEAITESLTTYKFSLQHIIRITETTAEADE